VVGVGVGATVGVGTTVGVGVGGVGYGTIGQLMATEGSQLHILNISGLIFLYVHALKHTVEASLLDNEFKSNILSLIHLTPSLPHPPSSFSYVI